MVPSRFARWMPLLLISAACGAAESPEAINPIAPAPSTQHSTGPTPTSVPRGSLTIRGVITERTVSGGSQPLARANVNAWVDTGGLGYSYMWANGASFSGGDGRYELTALPGGALVIADAYKEGYVQPCAAPPLRMNEDFVVDIELVPKALVSASSASVSNRPGFRSISGVIYEMTPDGKRPLANAFVDYEPIMDSPAATTVTDENGRYLLCGIPNDQVATIGTAVNINRVAYVDVPPGQTTADVVIP
jgi:hypothetical protein